MSTRIGVNINKNLIKSTNPITVKGGVVRVIDDATGDIARTTSGWIEAEQYQVYFLADAATVTAKFGSTVTRTGRLTGSITTSDATGKGRFVIGLGSGTGASVSAVNLFKYGIPLKASTSYRLTLYVNFSGIANAQLLTLQEFGSTGTRLAVNATTSESGTTSGVFVKRTFTFTTNASAVYGVITCGPAAAGNNQIFNADFNSMTLEEVSTITNSSSAPALLYPKATAVTSKDNIDQSQVTTTGSLALGNGTSYYRGQTFTPTKTKNASIIFQKIANVGSPTFDVDLIVEDTTNGKPNGTVVGTPVTITAAQWDAISNNTDYTVTYPTTLTAGTMYSFYLKPSAQGDASNHRKINANATGATYTGGTDLSYNGSTWSTGTLDLYFKTLYSKNTTNFTISTDTETLSVTAPTVDGWADGTIIDTATLGVTPLTLAPGANNVYYSSNGPATADGTVDPSLQSTVQLNQYQTKVRSAAVGRAQSTRRISVNDFGTNLKFTGGSTNSVYIENSDSRIYNGTGDLSFSCWVMCKLDGTADNLFSMPATAGNNRRYLFISSGGLLSLTQGSTQTASTYKFKPNTWTHVVALYDATNSIAKIYINGSLLVTSLTSVIGTGVSDLLIGNQSAASVQSLNGMIDQVRLYNRILSETEINDLYYTDSTNRNGLIGEWLFDEATGSTAYDTSGNGNHGAITDATYTNDVFMKSRTNV